MFANGWRSDFVSLEIAFAGLDPRIEIDA